MNKEEQMMDIATSNNMKIVKHRFLERKLNPETEILIIGTFNPATSDNPADFFYGRSRNYLWRLLPFALGEDDLKGKTKEEKLSFINKYKIDFIDLIAEAKVETGQEANYYDGYLDKQNIFWREIIREIEELKNLKKVCFTRITFSDIPNMSKQIKKIEKYCNQKNIKFQYLPTPSRFYNEEKQAIYNKFLTENDPR